MTLDDVTQEIVDLHVEFERWLGGTSTSLDRVEASLAPDFLFVGTDGAVVSRDVVLDRLRAGAGHVPVEIWIERVNVRWERGDLLCATYEEWQRHDDVTTSRMSSVVFERDQRRRLIWLSVHETWLNPASRG